MLFLCNREPRLSAAVDLMAGTSAGAMRLCSSAQFNECLWNTYHTPGTLPGLWK